MATENGEQMTESDLPGDAVIEALDRILARNDDPRTYADEVLNSIPDGWMKFDGAWIRMEQVGPNQFEVERPDLAWFEADGQGSD